MTEDDLELGESDSEEDFGFPPAERKVYTQPYDLSVQTLLEQWNSEILILPEIQREYVWDNVRASRLVESLMLNIPIPILYFAETAAAKYEIIDGHQRIRSIVRYIKNEFPLSGLQVLTEYKGSRYHQLPDREQRFIRMRTLRAVIIGVDSHPSMKFEIFERLNSGSIILNAQELRNSLYRGPFNQLLRDLAKNTTFRKILGTKNPRGRMVDEELTLRFFALHDNYSKYKTPLKQFLNEYMESKIDAKAKELERLRELFERTINRVHRLVGDNAFRLTDKNGDLVERLVNRSLFDSSMLAFSWVSGDEGSPRAVRRELAVLYKSGEFLDFIRRATGNRLRTRSRVRAVTEALKLAGIELDIPYKLSN